MSSNQESKKNAKISAGYGTLIFCLVAFTGVTAWSVVRLAIAIAQDSPDAFTGNSVSFLGIAFTAVAVARSWVAVKRVGQESDSEFRQRRLRFSRKAAIVIGAVLLIALALGIYLGIHGEY